MKKTREEIAELRRALARPVRPRLDEVRAIVGGTRSGAAAWERLYARGVIPDSWIGDDGRAFAATRVARFDSLAERARAEVPNAGVAAALASDVAGVAQAEALARELAFACSQWYGGRAERVRVVWRVGSVGAKSYVPGPVSILVDVSMERAWRDVRSYNDLQQSLTLDYVKRLMRERTGQQEYLAYAWRVANLMARRDIWHEMVNHGSRVRDMAHAIYGVSGPVLAVGKMFSELVDPHPIAVAIYGLGYGLEEWGARDVCLLAPPLPL